MPEVSDPLFELLVRKSRGRARANAVVEELALQLQVNQVQYDRALVAVALIKAGVPAESVGSLLSWNEFEGFCAGLLSAHGYSVKRNVVMTKPRRQIDIVAQSSDLGLSIDCKHWTSGSSYSMLEGAVRMQVERTSQYKKKFKVATPMLPVVVTMLDAPTRAVLGVPVVPIFALRDFLSTVSRFDEELRIL